MTKENGQNVISKMNPSYLAETYIIRFIKMIAVIEFHFHQNTIKLLMPSNMLFLVHTLHF